MRQNMVHGKTVAHAKQERQEQTVNKGGKAARVIPQRACQNIKIKRKKDIATSKTNS